VYRAGIGAEPTNYLLKLGLHVATITAQGGASINQFQIASGSV
jgi:hypothetical protein